jgi:prophage regulatory protein
MTDKLLRLDAVEDAIGLKKSKIYQMIECGEFPRPVKLGKGHINAWPQSEVSRWITERIAEREAIHG